MRGSLSTKLLWSLIALGMLLFRPLESSAGPKVYVGANVPANRLVSMDQINHQTWHNLLKKYVDENGLVSYAQWIQSAQDTQALDSYLAALSAASVDARASKNATLAFWINAYNAVTIRGILREYPTSSIRNHTAKAFGYNIWDDLQLMIGGKAYSLNQIEHEILRKMGEPRIHFAIVCASKSCPRLLNEAYTPNQLEAQLTKNTKAFFADRNNFQFDVQRRRFQLSSILKWFSADFGSNQSAQLRTIAPYLPTREAYDAALANSVSVTYLDYDWGLNDRGPMPGARP